MSLKFTAPVVFRDDKVPNNIKIYLGLTWQVVLGTDVPKAALKVATANKRKRYILPLRSSSIGMFDDSSIKLAPSEVEISLAGLFASLNPQKRIFLSLRIDDEHTWICGVANGSVQVGFDVVSTDQNEIKRLHEQFKSRYADCLVYGDDIGLADITEVITWDNLIDAVVRRENQNLAQSIQTRQSLSVKYRNIPKPIIWILALVVGYLLISNLVWPLASRLFSPKVEVVSVDPTSEWEMAIEDWAGKQRLATSNEVNVLLSMTLQTRFKRADWKMNKLECDWASVEWKCKASLKADSRFQTNKALVDSLPTDWRMEVIDMTNAVAHFKVPAPRGERLDIKKLKDRRFYEIESMTAIQSVRPVLSAGSTREIGAFSPVNIPPPKSPDNLDIAMPPGLKIPVISKVEISSPLRTLSSIGMEKDAYWSKFVLTIDQSKFAKAANSSVLDVKISGVIYAK